MAALQQRYQIFGTGNQNGCSRSMLATSTGVIFRENGLCWNEKPEFSSERRGAGSASPKGVVNKDIDRHGYGLTIGQA